jgi:glycosyltransferase involved in cell wall biosynthesis
MAKYAIELLLNQQKYQRFSQASKKRATEMFGIDKIVDQYEAYYEKVLSGQTMSVRKV